MSTRPGSLSLTRIERNVTTHTARGASTEPHAYIRIEINTGAGVLRATVDAGDWSRALAEPGKATPATLDVPDESISAA